MRGLSQDRIVFALVALVACACRGSVSTAGPSEEEDPGSQDTELPMTAPASGSGGSASEGGAVGLPQPPAGAGGGKAEPVLDPPMRMGGASGQPTPPLDLDLWCPSGDDWDLIREGEPDSLGGASSTDECPVLSRLSYGQSYCAIILESTQPLFVGDPGQCCYVVDTIHCR